MNEDRFETIVFIYKRIGTFNTNEKWLCGDLLSACGAWPVHYTNVSVMQLVEMLESCNYAEAMGYVELDKIDDAMNIHNVRFVFPHYWQAEAFSILYPND